MLQEVHKVIREFARGDRGPDALREWIAGNVQAVLNSGDQDAIAIIDELEALFARLSENLINEQAIMDAVTAMINAADTHYRPLIETLNGHSVVIETFSGDRIRPADDPSRVDRLVHIPA